MSIIVNITHEDNNRFYKTEFEEMFQDFRAHDILNDMINMAKPGLRGCSIYEDADGITHYELITNTRAQLDNLRYMIITLAKK